MSAAQRYLVFISDADQLCGVEAFTRLLAEHFGARAETHVLDADVAGTVRALKGRDVVVFNFPIVAWKPKLIAPGLMALIARLMGRDVVVVLHEWLALDWKRRVVLAPVVALASRIGFSASEIADAFAGTRFSRLVTGRRSVVPVPPNIVPPASFAETDQNVGRRALCGTMRRLGPARGAKSAASSSPTTMKCMSCPVTKRSTDAQSS